MSALKKLLSTHLENNFPHLGILALRITLGFLMMRHGFGKMENYSEYAPEFYNFLGLGASFSLILVIFSEFFCSLFLMLGLLTRYAAIPLVITMVVIVFDVHGSDPLEEKEMAVMYLGGYVALLLTGGGKFSIDKYISK